MGIYILSEIVGFVRWLVLLGVFLLCISSVSALNYHVRVTLDDNGGAFVQHLITGEGEFDVDIHDARWNGAVSDGHILSINKTGELSYTTNFDPGQFIMAFTAPVDISLMQFSVVLPRESVLKKPLSEGTTSEGSVFPKPTVVTSDGQSLILSWAYDDVKKGEDHSFFIEYKPPSSSTPIVLALFVAVLLGAWAWSRPKKEVVEHHIDTHLKENEEQVVNIIKQRDAGIDQGTLRVITGWSKAQLSRVLKEMEDRKLIHKEQRGKKNRVFLR